MRLSTSRRITSAVPAAVRSPVGGSAEEGWRYCGPDRDHPGRICGRKWRDTGRVRHPDETIQDVRNGEADAVLADGDFLLPIVNESNGELAVVGQESIGGGIGMGIRELMVI